MHAVWKWSEAEVQSISLLQIDYSQYIAVNLNIKRPPEGLELRGNLPGNPHCLEKSARAQNNIVNNYKLE